MRLILASSSPRRYEILKNAGYEFEVIPSFADENISQKMQPEELAASLSYKKAKDVFEKHKDMVDIVVIGADTIVVLDGKILGKPTGKSESFEMIKAMSGRKHDVYTGVSIIHRDMADTFFVKTTVEFLNIEDEQIRAYIDTGEPADKAGSYGIQGYGSVFVKRIEGDFYSVMGLPVSKVYEKLKGIGILPNNKVQVL
jgi:septum formation protein